MRPTFRQYLTLNSLQPDQVTEERLEEIFGQFFGGKPAPEKAAITSAIQAKKAGAPSSKAADWAKWVADQKAQQAKAGQKKPNVPDKAGARRADDFAFAQRGMAEGREITIPYRGCSIIKKEGGYHVMKGPKFVGHAKDHQEAMRVVDRHLSQESDDE